MEKRDHGLDAAGGRGRDQTGHITERIGLGKGFGASLMSRIFGAFHPRGPTQSIS